MIQYWILKNLFPVKYSKELETAKNKHSAKSSTQEEAIHIHNSSKFELSFGKDAWQQLQGKSILDFGCGSGEDAITFAMRGATHVTGLDIRQKVLDEAINQAKQHGTEAKCTFTTRISGEFDIIISQDAFEHYENPVSVLEKMKTHLAPQGEIWISFGPPWLHPNGAHLFSLFPWAHLFFSEKALMRWRADFKSDGATVFSEVEGGMNKMTLSRFKKIINKSGLSVLEYKTVPIRSVACFSALLPKEFTTSVVIAKLCK